ncbi:MAG: hypothetical protein QM664_02860 [Flavihumibacter sp.]
MPDAAEVAATAYKPVDEIRQELQRAPALYTSWFRIAFPRLAAWQAEKG